MKDPRDVPTDSLASLDQFGDRKFLFVAEVTGKFKNWRNIIHPLFILFFLILPWIKINGEQWVLLNIPERKFNIFGFSFWAHDAPLIFFIIAGSLIGLSFITAIWGRIWCGWACPQTVFIEGVFRKIEAFVEGNYLARKKLNSNPMDLSKFSKKTLKWGLFLLASLVITHSFLAYFVGSSELLGMIQKNPKENWTPFVVILITTAIILFDFGWFREQFCLIMCPYGRFQSVLMDKNSLAVLYDSKRGEPRKSKDLPNSESGDCINCFRCVSVCPTGIDIRNGLQMECIACTACIDACDEIMEKVNKPKGLIRYSSEAALAGEKVSHFRPRTLLYGIFLAILMAVFAFVLSQRNPIKLTILRAIEEPYKIINNSESASPQLLNHFKVHIQNQSSENIEVNLKIEAPQLQLIAPDNPSVTESKKKKWIHFFVKMDLKDYQLLENRKIPIQFEMKGLKFQNLEIQEIQLLGP
jgi:cytochrome c oxidase accessory protein FixG